MERIYEGILIKGAQSDVPFEVRKLTVKDLPAILLVQEQVVLTLEDKGLLQPLTREEFQYILTGNGLMTGAWVKNELIAFRALLVPPIDDEHLGWDIGLAEKELPKVIYQEISNVLPDYRGNKLQKTLASLIMVELDKLNHTYRYIFCTVAPFNIPSLKDKFAQGMKIAALKEKYGGRLRYIFVKDLEETEAVEWKEALPIQMSDIDTQKQKLDRGWRGIHTEEKEGIHWIYFAR